MGPKQKDQDYFYSITSYFEKEITDRELLCDTSELRKDFLNSMCIHRILFFPILKGLSIILEKELNVKIKLYNALIFIHLLPFEGKAFLKI